jgi:tetratricopeptide (TPR) repeat protein
MTKLQLTRSFPWIQRKQKLSHSAKAPPPPLSAELDAYTQALDALRDEETQTLLRVLLARDALTAARAEMDVLPPPPAQRLLELDTRLRERATDLPLDALPDWRQTFEPPETAWWWRLDERVAKRKQQNDLPWVLLTGTFTLLTAALTTEILTRLWDGAPDVVSVFGSLVTLALTASPLVKRGRELGGWMVDHVLKFKLRYRAEALAALTGLVLVIVLGIRLALPPVAVLYNNQGFAARQVRNYARAQRKFQRAVALHPDNAVAAYNLAEVYARLRESDKAAAWYRHAIAADLDFAPAYRGLGHLYNEQGQHAEGEAVLAAGLAVVGESPTAKADVVARYELLADLGWAYAAQEQVTLAQRALEDAVALEDTLKEFENAEPGDVQYRQALPHYYLAQLYEAAGDPQAAYAAWENCLRLLRPGWANNMAWRIEAQEHITQLKEVLP